MRRCRLTWHRFLPSHPECSLICVNVRSRYPEKGSRSLKVSSRNLKRCSKSGKTCLAHGSLSRFICLTEAVAHSRDGDDKARSVRQWFDFLAQERHVDVQ